MNQSLLILLLALVTALAPGCRKSAEPGPVPTQNFQPLGTGSYWNYRVTGTSNYDFTLLATDRDTLINSRLYRLFTNSAGNNEYFHRTVNNYFRFSEVAELNNQPVELLYLKENLNTGQSWVETKIIPYDVTGFGRVPVTVRFTFTITQKDVDYTVDGTRYNNVTVVTGVPQFSAALLSVVPIAIPSSSDIRYYYAAGIGLIYTNTSLQIPLANVDTNTETSLVSYQIR
ncbi:MAG TPA: hypothetical protein PKE63_09435 [Lacibacter sp.]|nr:hypothetical protein [Lacibacter sp.]HMO90081.1 hypothetical protein [Lacibacter sp.]HMP87487.1 hypothetical protein [Lacibacter sp.]